MSHSERKTLAEPHPAPVDALQFPRFAGVPTFMPLPHISDPGRLDVALIGVPYDGGSSYRPGRRFGPRHIREQSTIIRPYHPVLAVNPFEKLRVADYGDLSTDTYARITAGLQQVLDAGRFRCGWAAAPDVWTLGTEPGPKCTQSIAHLWKIIRSISGKAEFTSYTSLLRIIKLQELRCSENRLVNVNSKISRQTVHRCHSME